MNQLTRDEYDELVDANCSRIWWRGLLITAIGTEWCADGTVKVTAYSATHSPMTFEIVENPEPKPRFQWVCGAGCGNCAVKRIEFEYSRTETPDGDLVESKTEPQLVSMCCGAALVMWDNEKDEEVRVVLEDHPFKHYGVKA